MDNFCWTLPGPPPPLLTDSLRLNVAAVKATGSLGEEGSSNRGEVEMVGESGCCCLEKVGDSKLSAVCGSVGAGWKGGRRLLLKFILAHRCTLTGTQTAEGGKCALKEWDSLF